MIVTTIDNKKVYITEELINYLTKQKQDTQKTEMFLPVTTEDVNVFLLNNHKALFDYDDNFNSITKTSYRTQNGGPKIDKYNTQEMESFSLDSSITQSLTEAYHVRSAKNLTGRVLGIYALPLNGDKKFVFGVYAVNEK